MIGNLDSPTLIARIIVLIIAFSVHEFAHAWMADYFGDSTPRLDGRLTLNPLVHLDPMGTLMLILAGFGWAKPVTVNPYTLRRSSPSAMMWVSFAGPLSNLLMAVLAAIPFRLGLVDPYYPPGRFLPSLSQLLIIFIFINLILALLNLIPLAPLDGEKIADYFFPPSWADVLNRIRPYGPMILLFLFISGYVGLPFLEWILFRPAQFLLRLLVG